jgi:hypothetical protein
MANRVVDSSDNELELAERVLMSVLQDLQGVQLHIYEIENNRIAFEEAIDDSIATLKQENWQTVLKVKEDEEHIVVMQSGDEGRVSGYSVLVSTPDNAVFMNLMGQLNPESITLIAESLAVSR